MFQCLCFGLGGAPVSVSLFILHRGPPWRLTNFNEQSLSFHWSIEGVLTCKVFPYELVEKLKTTISGGFFRYAHFFRVWWTTFSWVHPNRCFYDLYAWLTTEPHEDLMKQRKKLRNRKARLYSTIYENCWSASAIKKSGVNNNSRNSNNIYTRCNNNTNMNDLVCIHCNWLRLWFESYGWKQVFWSHFVFQCRLSWSDESWPSFWMLFLQGLTRWSL